MGNTTKKYLIKKTSRRVAKLTPRKAVLTALPKKKNWPDAHYIIIYYIRVARTFYEKFQCMHVSDSPCKAEKAQNNL